MATIRVEKSRDGGIGFLGALTLLFIALKLLGLSAVATWSWWWVLSPLWIPIALLIAVGVIWGLIYAIVEIVSYAIATRKRSKLAGKKK